MLSRTAEYALRAAVCLARETESPSAADALAQATQVPRRYLHTVLQDLVRAGLVGSQPGPGGGYYLARTPDKVTILDVVNAVTPLERIRHCPLGLPSHTSLCPLHKQLDDLYAHTETVLGQVTLDQLMASSSKIIPLCEVTLGVTDKPSDDDAPPAKPRGRRPSAPRRKP